MLILSAFSGLLLSVFLAACQASPSSSIPFAGKTLRVVIDNNYPPYSFLDNAGNLQGISVDQWKLWQQKTGIAVDLVGMDWGEAQNHMVAGEFDVIDTIFINEARQKIYDFSEPYAKIDVPVFFHKNILSVL